MKFKNIFKRKTEAEKLNLLFDKLDKHYNTLINESAHVHNLSNLVLFRFVETSYKIVDKIKIRCAEIAYDDEFDKVEKLLLQLELLYLLKFKINTIITISGLLTINVEELHNVKRNIDLMINFLEKVQEIFSRD